MTESEVRAKLEKAIQDAGSAKAFAGTCSGTDQWGNRRPISAQYLNDIRRGRRAVGDPVLIALGLRRVVTYEEIAG